MHLTRMRLNPTRVTTKRLLASPQVTHALVLGSFPDPSAREGGRVLWRLDGDRAHELELYIASPDRPDLTGIVEQAGWPTRSTWDTADYQPFLDRLQDGQRWRFRLTANPVRSSSRGAGRRGVVSPHRTVGHQEAWFLGRSATWGFAIPTTAQGAPELVVRGRHTSDFRRAAQPDGRVTISQATFDGTLEVRDAGLLRTALTHGMGRAKGYGCGLMTLAPLP